MLQVVSRPWRWKKNGFGESVAPKQQLFNQNKSLKTQAILSR
jgi:hypothetical protein